VLFRSIQLASDQAVECTQDKQQYTILLIITDGVITDMDPTIDAIITASSRPLSIVIVGVGSADFTDMNRLDGDDQLLRSQGRQAQRDIAQFVPFREFLSQPNEALAKVTLAEIPGQVLSYMKSRGIVPNPPVVATPSQP